MGTLQLRRAVWLALVVVAACNDMSAEETVTVPDSGQMHRVLIRTSKPYDAMVRSIEEMGGRVTQQYRFVDAIAAEVPDRGLVDLRAQLPEHAISKDVVRPLDGVARDREGKAALLGAAAERARVLEPESIRQLAADRPDAYALNTLGLMNMAPLFGEGHLGEGIKVAVIDSGIRPGFFHLESDGSVIGGENLSGDGLSFSDAGNDGHGTFVSGMISANAAFEFDPADPLAVAVSTHCPDCVVQVDDDGDGVVDATIIPMIGSAPSASIYMLKIFDAFGGTTNSIVLAAMERVLELKQNFLDGQPETQNPDGSFTAANIQVVNMSLGGPTLFAGRDLEGELTRQFAELGIVFTKSAGNAGPSGTTGGSPGAGIGGLAVGAATVAMNERVAIDLSFGAGFGTLWRATEHTQTASFSARGPTSDGRADPELVSSGDWNFGQGFAEGITLASGTSFSAPAVAGVAAVMREVAPEATAREVEAALVQSANPNILADRSTALDQGAGYVDGTAAADLLLSGDVIVEEDEGDAGSTLLGNVDDQVRVVRKAVPVTRSARQLRPGQRFEIYYDVPKGTSRVIATLHHVLPGAVENEIFGDDILFTVHSSKTHFAGSGDYIAFAFSRGGVFVFQDPEPGLMRVTLSGDWTNASPIDAQITLERSSEPLSLRTAFGSIAEGQDIPVEVTVPESVDFLDVELRWKRDWGRYPTSDIDVIAFAPDGTIFADGATLDAPELFTVTRPVPGPWLFVVNGFTVFQGEEEWALSVNADGTRLRRD